eukprot:scaffold260145_cov16-Tisochrysis_lutea.AAC.2
MSQINTKPSDTTVYRCQKSDTHKEGGRGALFFQQTWNISAPEVVCALRGEDSIGVVKPEGLAERSGTDMLLIGPE